MKRTLMVSLPILMLLSFGCAGLLHVGYPVTEGKIAGLPVHGEVKVLRDAKGIPHITAGDEHDLFVAQGFVHAQDRMWQMETYRRLIEGRLAEVVGEEAVEMDLMSRLLGWPEMKQTLAEAMGEEEKDLAEAYAEGVNAYLRLNEKELPLEFRSLGFTPDPWKPEDVLSNVIMNAWFLETNYRQELAVLYGMHGVDAEGWMQILPAYFNEKAEPEAYLEKIRHLKIGPLLKFVQVFYEPSKPIKRGSGSNNWVVAKSADGKPMLSSDPHLGLLVPGVWYFCSLDAPGVHIEGASMAGSPGIVIGHNGKIAWGFTNVMTDIVDLYVLRLDPADHGRYLVEDRSLPFDKIKIELPLPKGKKVEQVLYSTVYGPVITRIEPDTQAVAALRWYGTMPSLPAGDRTLRAMIDLNRAGSVQEALNVFSGMRILGQNLVCADVEGNIGWHPSGAPPIRKGYTGRFPADGSSGQMDWTGYLPYDRMPSEYNPERGFIATANARVVDDNAPHTLTTGWCTPYRRDRIVQRLSELKNPTREDYVSLQLDVHSLQADRILPILETYTFTDPRALKAVAMLSEWDRQVTADSPEASLFEVFQTIWTRHLLEDEVGPEGLRLYYHVFGAALVAPDQMLEHPDSPLWDRKNTPEKETPRQILEESLIETVAWLEKNLGEDPVQWNWGRIHTYFFAYPGAASKLEHRLLSVAPIPAPGDNNTVNVACFDPGKDGYSVQVIPSLRMIAPLSDLNQTTITGPMGQSGQPGHPHYADMIEPWMRGEGTILHPDPGNALPADWQSLILAP